MIRHIDKLTAHVGDSNGATPARGSTFGRLKSADPTSATGDAAKKRHGRIGLLVGPLDYLDARGAPRGLPRGGIDEVNDPLWYVVIQAAAAVATTIGVLVALYVTVIREPQKAAEERKRHQTEMDALNRAEADRVTAQARKIVPSCVRAPMFGNNWWTVKIDNTSNGLTTLLSAHVAAIGSDGTVMPNGCSQSNNTMPIDQAFDKSIRAALYGSLQGGLDRSGFGSMISRGSSQQLANQIAPTVKQAMQEAMVGHFVTEWQKTLGPNQSALMAYTTTEPDLKLRITIEYEDEAGYHWRRTDSTQPIRVADGAS